MGGKHEIWQNDTFRGGEFKFIRSHSKIDVRTISGDFRFLSICLLVKDENVKIFSLKVHNLSHTIR